MKHSAFFAFSFLLLVSLFFTGCCSYVNLDRGIPKEAEVEGCKPLASFYVQNTSYQILGFIPWCSGVNWTDDKVPFEDANDWHVDFFDDNVTLDNNIRTLKRACKEVGSNRIASLSHLMNEDNLWSFLLINRKTLKTSCFILEKKQPSGSASVK